VLNIELNSSLGATTTISGIETINATSFGATAIDFTKITDVTKFSVTDGTGQVTLSNVSDASMILGAAGSGTNTIVANYKAGTLSGSSDNLAIELDGASAVSITADAGFETATLSTGGAASAAGQAATAGSSLTLLSAPGVSSLTVEGAGNLTLNADLPSLSTLDASAMTGAIVGKTISSTSGLSSEGMTGGTSGSTIKLGSGADNIKFTGAEASNKSNSIKLGAGDDTIDVANSGSGATYVFGEAGDDTIKMSVINADDIVNGGAGDDTLKLAVSTSHAGILRGVENVSMTGTSTFALTSADNALAVTANADGADDDINITGLSSGSTVVVGDGTTDASGDFDSLQVTYASVQDAATIDIDIAMTGANNAGDDLSFDKISNLTIDAAKAITVDSNIVGLIAEDAKTVTINAAKAVDLGAGVGDNATGADSITSFTLTSSGGAVDTHHILNSDALATLTVTTASGNATVGDIEGAKALTNVTVTAGSTGTATTGEIGGTTEATAVNSFTVAGGAVVGGNSAIVGDLLVEDSLGTVTISGTEGKVDVGAITVDDVGDAGAIGDVTITATKGELEVEGITSDKSLNSVTLTSTAGALDMLANGGNAIGAADTTGITVSLTAKTFISGNGTDTTDRAQIANSKGDVALTVAGAAAASLEVTAGGASAATSGTATVTSTNTGGLDIDLINGAVSGDGSISSASITGKTGVANTVSFDGVADTINVTGGAGDDTVDFIGTNTFLAGTFSLGSGTDTVDFTNYAATGDNKAAYDGLVINLGSSAVTFDAGTATAASVLAGKVVGYDVDAASTLSNIDAKGSTFTLSSVESVIGTAAADYIVANDTGTTMEGGAGNDTMIGGAAADVFDFGSTLVDDGTGGGTATAGTVLDVAASVGTDTITFVVADDQFRVSETIFGDMGNGTSGAGSALAANQFHSQAGTGTITNATLDVTGNGGFIYDTTGNDLYFYEAGATYTSTTTTLAGMVAAGDAYMIVENMSLTGTLAATDFDIIA
jgi:hypothetical protein